MNPEPTCKTCGTPLSGEADEGICPKCLAAAAMETGAGATSTGSPTVRFQSNSKDDPPSPEEIARHFPELEILEPLGQGGMGCVYKARQPRLDRLVALKILSPQFAGDPTFAERFNREARALAQLSHNGIVTVHDFGQAGPYYFLLMEYVDGVDLRALVQAGELSPEQALAIVPDICDALQYAHDEGIVHRDIKPANILVDKKGRVKIADFGLAKLGNKPATDVTLTVTEQVMGTPQYMAPEQMKGTRGVDHRADIYSLGVVFYEMLTGNLPMGRFDPPSKKVQVDLRLDEVVLRALEQEPDRRYQQASEVKTDVQSIRSNHDASEVGEPQADPATATTELSGAVIGKLAGIFVAGWLALGFLWNLGWIGLALGAAGLCGALLIGRGMLVRQLPAWSEAWQADTRVRRWLRVSLSMLLFCAAVAAVVRLHMDVEERREKIAALSAFQRIADGESVESRKVMERLPAYRNSKLNDGVSELWIGSGRARYRVPGDPKRLLGAAVIPGGLTLLAAWLLMGTRRFRRDWQHRRKPALILTSVSLGTVLLIAFVGMMRPESTWNGGWPGFLLDAKLEKVSTSLAEWTARNGYDVRGEKEKEIHRPDGSSSSNHQVGRMRVLWIRPGSMFDRYRVTPHGIRRPQPTLVVTLIGNLEAPHQTHVSIDAGSYRKPSSEEDDWKPVLQSLETALRSAEP